MSLDIEKIKEDNKMEIELEEGALTEYTYTMLRAAVAETIIKYRKKMGYTQKDLAKVLRISQARVAKLENGINITLKTLCDINEKIETKEYSFILDVLSDLQASAKKLYKENYYIEISKVLDYTNWNYCSNKNSKLSYTTIQVDNEIIYTDTYSKFIA